MGKACGTHGSGTKSIQGLVGKPKGKRHSEDRGIGEMMGSELILGRLACVCVGEGGVQSASS
jgi:hypothetical protein